MTIKEINLILQNKTPIIIKTGKKQLNIVKTLNFIPGSTLYGAIVNQILLDHYERNNTELLSKIYKDGWLEILNDNNKNNEEIRQNSEGQYRNWIQNLSSDMNTISLKVSDFLPVNINKNNHQNSISPYPPLDSIFRCRVNGNHISDGLLHIIIKNRIIQEQNTEEYKYFAFSSLKCPYYHCNSSMKKGTSLLQMNLKENKIEKVEFQTEEKIGIGINERTYSILRESIGKDTKGYLFYQETIQPNQYFAGKIIFNDNIISLSKLKEYIESCNIGAKKSVNFGKLRIISHDVNERTIDKVKEELYKKYQKNHNDLIEYQEKYNLNPKMIIPFLIYSNTSITAMKNISNYLATKFNCKEINFIKGSYEILSLKDFVSGKSTHFGILPRGSTGYIQNNKILEGKTKEEFFNFLSNIEIFGFGTNSAKGLSEIRFFPNIFYHNQKIKL
ncbi:MAG: hypothetical protein K9W44_00585 [Candidatus Lokiarchaeota archaeon]|nr:hypothetical protein [Candidatus Harpocratesius repetitus]